MYVLEIIPEHVNNLDETLLEIQKLIPSISKEDITLFHKLRRQNRSFMPIALKMKLTQEEIAKNDFNISPSRYIHTGAGEEYRPIAEIVEELETLETEAAKTSVTLRAILVKVTV